MTTAATSLLGLALPVTGELSGTWGDTVNNSITALLDSAVAGTTTLSADADVTLTTTTLAANQAREAIILWTAGGTVTRTITAPAQSKAYVVINKTSGTQSITLVGAGPTTGVTIIAGTTALVAWDGVDFVRVSVLAAGLVPVANGGTNLSSGTSGGVLYYSASGTLASSAALAASALVIGGGAGATPATTTTGTGVVTALGSAVNTTGGFLTVDGTATLTNKRINPRTSTAASTATLTPDLAAYDQYNLTAQAVSLAVAAPNGTPVDGNRLMIRILDNGTTRAITWDVTYTAIGSTLPTATAVSKMTYVGCVYNAANLRWDVVAVATQV